MKIGRGCAARPAEGTPRPVIRRRLSIRVGSACRHNMSNLLASLVSSAGTLEAYGQVLETAQNNVANASTPGYAKQRMELYALPFDPQGGATGGVRAGKLVTSRNEYAE